MPSNPRIHAVRRLLGSKTSSFRHLISSVRPTKPDRLSKGTCHTGLDNPSAEIVDLDLWKSVLNAIGLAFIYRLIRDTPCVQKYFEAGGRHSGSVSLPLFVLVTIGIVTSRLDHHSRILVLHSCSFHFKRSHLVRFGHPVTILARLHHRIR